MCQVRYAKGLELILMTRENYRKVLNKRLAGYNLSFSRLTLSAERTVVDRGKYGGRETRIEARDIAMRVMNQETRPGCWQ